jgi:hypothetical protein
MTKVFAIVLIFALFPVLIFSIIGALLLHPLFLLLLLLGIFAWPAIQRLRKEG